MDKNEIKTIEKRLFKVSCMLIIIFLVNLRHKSNNLNAEFFIAKKIIKEGDTKNRISKPIVKITLASIAIGISVMIITVAIVSGFQKEIREKVIGFGSHIQITQLEDNSSMESSPILIQQEFVDEIKQNPSVKHIQNYAYKPAILQTDFDTSHFQFNGKDTISVNRDIAGVLFKGIDSTYDWSFFEDKLVQGELFSTDTPNNDILISQYIANLLHYQVGDEVNAYFVMNNNPKKRVFKIKGIYRTGLEDFDKKIIFTQLQQIQSINNWGVETFISLKDSCINGQFVLQAMSYGKTGEFLYDWGHGFTPAQMFYIDTYKSHDITLLTKAVEYDFYGHPKDAGILYDTTHIHIQVDSACYCSNNTLHPIEVISDSLIKTPFGHVSIKLGGGTGKYYTGGFEVTIKKWEDLEQMDDMIYNNIPYDFQSQKITDLNPEIFAWLDFLDMNILIIITLMIIVSLINMVTSLLVLILEKTNMIGLLKAMGATNWSIRKIFIYNTFYLLFRGLFWGNVVGLGLIAIQYFFNLIPLDPQVYYLDKVPIYLNFSNWFMLNALTVITCFIILWIPSWLITKIKPVKAIKFN